MILIGSEEVWDDILKDSFVKVVLVIGGPKTELNFVIEIGNSLGMGRVYPIMLYMFLIMWVEPRNFFEIIKILLVINLGV